MIGLRTNPCLKNRRLLRQALRAGRKISPGASYRFGLWFLGEHYRRLDLRQGKLAVSFDCDYAEDSLAADRIRERLDHYGIKTSWAVVGEWVRKFPDIYRRLLNSGHELVNHTLTHPDNNILRPNDPRKFAMVTFDERRDEIRRCHELVGDLLGCEMRGFRAPHFSMSPDVYPILAECKYLYSSSNLSAGDSFAGGVHNTREGVVELPLLAAPVSPYLVPATYFLYRSPQRLYRDEADFYQQFVALLKVTSEKRLVTMIYFDPCDVVRFRKPPFEAYLKAALDAGLELCRMDDVALWLRGRCSQTIQ